MYVRGKETRCRLSVVDDPVPTSTVKDAGNAIESELSFSLSSHSIECSHAYSSFASR